MPWWSWILLWVALIALALLFYVLLGIRLFRQFMVTARELGAAGERFGHLAPEHAPEEASAPQRPADWAVLPHRNRCAMIT